MGDARVFNFGAGPAMLPEAILKEAQEELLNWNHLGISILELGHRTPQFAELLERATLSLRELLSIPDHYEILFLGGPARTQFASIPLNLLHTQDKAGYIITGIWSKLAFQEAQFLKQAYCISSEEKEGFKSLPSQRTRTIKENTTYIYYTPNETVNGVKFSYIPETGNIPLIADMTSCLLTEPIDIKHYGLIFAGAQKNIANAGLTLVIIRKDLLEKINNSSIPTMLNYKIQALHHSSYATPPTFNCYLADKMFTWIKNQGGVQTLFHQNCLKAEKLYAYLDSSDFYQTSVHKNARSMVNICFALQRPELESQFIQQAEKAGLYALKGHRTVGGLRASLYNAMPMEGVEALILFMSEFEREYA